MSRDRYNPFWEEPAFYQNMSKLDRAYHEGYEDGYSVGSEYREKLDDLEQQNEALRGLIGANVRVMREELKKEIAQENQKQIRTEDLPTTQASEGSIQI